MRGRRVIDATGLDGPIRSIRGGITVGGTRVPLDDVGVLLLGSTATVSGGALTLLARYDVVVLNCMWNGVPDGVFYGWSDNSRIAARHRAQADLSIPRQKSAWQEIVKAKIRGQANACAAAGIIEAGHLRGIAKQVRSGDTTNCEAHAARVFWQAYFGAAESFRRVPGGADRVNAMLNYGYTVLRGFVIQAVCAAGLSPTLAIWHRHRANTFALADDLIERTRLIPRHGQRSPFGLPVST